MACPPRISRARMLRLLYPPDPRTEKATMREGQLCAAGRNHDQHFSAAQLVAIARGRAVRSTAGGDDPRPSVFYRRPKARPLRALGLRAAAAGDHWLAARRQLPGAASRRMECARWAIVKSRYAAIGYRLAAARSIDIGLCRLARPRRKVGRQPSQVLPRGRLALGPRRATRNSQNQVFAGHDVQAKTTRAIRPGIGPVERFDDSHRSAVFRRGWIERRRPGTGIFSEGGVLRMQSDDHCAFVRRQTLIVSAARNGPVNHRRRRRRDWGGCLRPDHRCLGRR